MTVDDKFYTVEAMQRFGGSFVSALGLALSKADMRNEARIMAAFPDYIAEYGPGSKFFEAVAESH